MNLFVQPIYNALKGQIKAFTANLKYGGIDYAKRQLTREILNERIGPVIQKLYVRGGLLAANRTLRLMPRMQKEALKQTVSESISYPLQKMRMQSEGAISFKYRGFGHNQKWTEDILRYFRLHLLEKAVLPISDTMKAWILRTLEKGINEGWSIDQIVKELETSDFPRNRTITIVRTETVRATNFGGMLAAFESDYEIIKKWLAVKDNRTRRSHRHTTGVDGEQRDLLARFSNGLLYPGDPEGSPLETIMCRCVLQFIAKRDERGRLIPKEGVNVAGYRQSIIDAFDFAAIGQKVGII